MLTDKNQTRAVLLPGVSGTTIKVKQEAEQAMMYFQAAHTTSDTHPVPLAATRGQLPGLIQIFLAGTRVTNWAEINGRRWPATGRYGYRIVPDCLGFVRRRLRKWRAQR